MLDFLYVVIWNLKLNNDKITYYQYYNNTIVRNMVLPNILKSLWAGRISNDDFFQGIEKGKCEIVSNIKIKKVQL